VLWYMRSSLKTVTAVSFGGLSGYIAYPIVKFDVEA
jgi:hypothetical protein